MGRDKDGKKLMIIIKNGQGRAKFFERGTETKRKKKRDS